jgi:hypothetical protein
MKKIVEVITTPRNAATRLAVRRLRWLKMVSGMSGCADRRSIPTNAASRTTVTTRAVMTPAEPQPLLVAWEIP